MTVSRLRGERGSGIVSSLAGVTMFLAFLLLAVHVVVGLYAESVVTDAAAAGARRAAGSSLTDDPEAPHRAEAKIRDAPRRARAKAPRSAGTSVLTPSR